MTRGGNSYASRELLQWATAQGEQEFELSTLNGTTPVKGTVLTFLAKHEDLGEEIPIKTLITPDKDGRSMKLKPRKIQVPKWIADKYQWNGTEQLLQDGLVVGDKESTFEVGGKQALLLLGQDNEVFSPRKNRNLHRQSWPTVNIQTSP